MILSSRCEDVKDVNLSKDVKRCKEIYITKMIFNQYR